MVPAPIRVLYIAGSGRSGSTFLANLLGSVPGAFAAGELRYLFQRGMIEDRLCGCGATFSDCPLWRTVVDRAGFDPAIAEEMAQAVRAGSRARDLPALVLAHRRRPVEPAIEGTVEERLRHLYLAIAEVSGARCIVDSSKLPTYGYQLQGVEGLDVRFVHLVRDPRAAAFSWTRAKPVADRPGGPHMQQRSPLASSVLWSVWNAAALAFWADVPDRYLRVRYEDLVGSPRSTFERVADFAGLDPTTLPFLDESSVQLEANHSVAGNPVRHLDGPVQIRADEEWATAMPHRQRAIVTAVSAPLMRTFRYPILATTGAS